MAGKRIVKIAPELIMEVLEHGSEWDVVVETGLPVGTRLLAADLNHDWSNGSICARLLVESDDWPDLSQGEEIPNFAVVVRDMSQVRALEGMGRHS